MKALFLFSLPMILGNFFQQLYNTVDSAIVGRYVGETALAAVGPPMPSPRFSSALSSEAA